MIMHFKNPVSAHRFNAGAAAYTLTATKQLTPQDDRWIFVTASSGQAVKMPDATALEPGWTAIIQNYGTADITAQNDSGSDLQTIESGSACWCTLRDGSTSAGTWYVASMGSTSSGGGAFDGWAYKCQITIDAAEVDLGIVDYVLTLTESNLPAQIFNATTGALSTGGDIRLSTDSLGVNRLPVHLSYWDKTSSKAVIRSLLTVSAIADTSLWIWWGKIGESQPAADASYGANACYPSDVALAYDMSQDPSAGNVTDWTGNGSNGVPGGTMTAGDLVSASKMGRGLDFDGTDDHLAVSGLNIGSAYTVLSWLNLDVVTANGKILFGAPYSVGFNFYDTAYKWLFLTGSGSAWDSYTASTASTAPTAGVFFHAGARYNAGVVDYFNNGSDIGGYTVATSRNFPAAIQICRRSDIGGAYVLDGTISDFIIFSRALPDGEISTYYNNQNAPGTFAAAGSVISL